MVVSVETLHMTQPFHMFYAIPCMWPLFSLPEQLQHVMHKSICMLVVLIRAQPHTSVN